MSWSARQYVAFEDERTRPARDLLAAIPTVQARSVVDIGCGPGNSTELLVQRFEQAQVRGLDSSADMIDAALKRLPQLQFEVAEIDSWGDQGPFDVIFANAVLQWVPDHATLLSALAAKLSDGGSLAIQMPDNLNEPSHRLMREVAANGPWAAKLAGAAGQRTDMASASDYFSMLRLHCSRVDVWRTTYHHQLSGGAAGVVEWFKGSGLIPFLSPLTEEERAQYLQQYLAAVAEAYPALPDGSVLLPFPRLFIVATR
ncbi:trans-aconitate 2-methyltransferase [Pseudomonas sp. LAMO17WK12:I6]|jgi:trans-aconitate 2-methyltransferase|uniref:trans-aconitate 2-methyltransferase n=1 Tax=unclassified Pseudomonas TaxID=196821 RepID=UPI000BD62A12|nr:MULTISPECIES: trans-aconitate 2-methyltransferase [unclassified Pseudomonas]SNY05728.1 trans-aconitate 2-methyltransferase [Pseudomonas sp. LAMO17WK12:I5]SNY05767.1 trans-aconitate 2-methyltransferase [Pseudomonas sp. LAMO17WK12:I6]